MQYSSLSAAQKRELTNLLLSCACMADRQRRDSVVDQLPANLRHNIDRDESNRADVLSILNASLDYDNGLGELIEAIRFFENDSLPMQSVDRYLANLSPNRPFSTDGSSKQSNPSRHPAGFEQWRATRFTGAFFLVIIGALAGLQQLANLPLHWVWFLALLGALVAAALVWFTQQDSPGILPSWDRPAFFAASSLAVLFCLAMLFNAWPKTAPPPASLTPSTEIAAATDTSTSSISPSQTPDLATATFTQTNSPPPLSTGDTSTPTRTGTPTFTLTPSPDTATPTSTPTNSIAPLFFFASDLTGNWDIFSQRTDGTGLTQVTDNLGIDDQPALSPDGHSLAFISNRGVGVLTLYILDLRSNTMITLPATFSNIAQPAWSPDSQTIAVSAQVAGARIRNIYLISADGTLLNRVTSGKVTSDQYPTWAPDGTQLAYINGRSIYTIDIDGRNLKEIHKFNANIAELDWSPDGTVLAYASDEDGDWDLYAINLQSFSSQNLTNNQDIEDRWPRWSLDGSQMLFHSNRQGNTDIYLLNVADGLSGGSARVERLIRQSAIDKQPDW